MKGFAFRFSNRRKQTGKRKSALKHPVRWGRWTVYLTDEGLEHFRVCEWLRAKGLFFIHVPSEAKRSPAERNMLHALGAVPGASDILIFDSPERYNPNIKGVAIEMKSMTGKATENQFDFLEKLEKRGWFCSVCNGAEAAIKVLEDLYGKIETKDLVHQDHKIGG